MAAPFVARHTFSIGQHVPHAIALAAAAASGTALHTGFLVAAQAYDMQPQHSWKRAGSCKQAWHPP